MMRAAHEDRQGRTILNAVLPIEFKQYTDFLDVHVSGTADFAGSVFREWASFTRMRVGGTLFWCKIQLPAGGAPAILEGRADFENYTVQGAANFSGAEFREPAEMVNFRVEGTAYFRGTAWHKGVNLSRCHVGGMAIFDSAHFEGDSRFIESRFRTIYFDRIEGNGKWDLRGCVYEALIGDWRRILDAQIAHAYHRQPYTQMSKVFRNAGYEREAGEIFYLQRKRELKRRWDLVFRRKEFAHAGRRRATGEIIPALFMLAQWILFRFGVRPMRLLFATICILVLGAVLFGQRGAVMMRSAPPGYSRDFVKQPLNGYEAAAYSLRLFTPGLDTSLGGTIIPSDRQMFGGITYDSYAALQKAAGLLFVPLGIAAAAGLLVRREK